MDIPAFVVTGPAVVEETDETVSVSIRRTTDVTNQQSVTVTTDDPSVVPPSEPITIPAGETSVTVQLSIVNDSIVTGSRVVSVDANAAGFLEGNAALTVLEDDLPELSISLDRTEITEGQTATIVAHRNADIDSVTFVQLTSSGERELQFDQFLVIPVGSQTGELTIQSMSDDIALGNGNVTLTATAPRFLSTSSVLTIVDDEIASFSVDPTSNVSLVESESGKISVVLDAKPASEVSIRAKASDSDMLRITGAGLQQNRTRDGQVQGRIVANASLPTAEYCV